MFDPAEPRRAWLAAAIAGGVILAHARRRAAAAAAAAGGGGARRGRRPSRSRCWPGGAADEELRPERWGSLLGPDRPRARGAAGRQRALPRRRRGDDARARRRRHAARGRWPRCSPSGPARAGGPASGAAALILLVTLYAVPAVVLDFEGEFLRGALLAVLVLAFLRLERLPVGDVPAAGDRGRRGRDRWRCSPRRCSTGASRGGTTSAGRSTPPRARAVGFSWDHDYSPLDWPRDGREMLRVKARQARVLEGAATSTSSTATSGARTRGRAARRSPRSCPPNIGLAPHVDPADRRHAAQPASPTRSSPPGIATAVRGEPSYPLGGGVFAAPDGIGKGDTYTADVYTPRPSDRQLRSRSDRLRGLAALLPLGDPPAAARARSSRRPSSTWPGLRRRRRCPRRSGSTSVPFDQALERAGLDRIWALAQELKAGTESPFEYMEAVEAHLAGDYAYSETPPEAGAHARRLPLRREGRLLPAVLGRRGAAAADGRRSRPRGDRLHVGLVRRGRAGVRRARPRRALLGRGLVPRVRLGAARPDARPGAAAQPAGGGARRSAPRARSRARRRSAASASASSTRAAASAQDDGDWTLLIGGGVVLVAVAAGGAHARVAPPPAAPAARAAADGRVRARAAPRALRPAARGSRSRGWSAASRAGRARPATSARCVSSATRVARSPPRRPSSAAGCARRCARDAGRAARVVGAAAADGGRREVDDSRASTPGADWWHHRRDRDSVPADSMTTRTSIPAAAASIIAIATP